jgi:hypothetical protein
MSTLFVEYGNFLKFLIEIDIEQFKDKINLIYNTNKHVRNTYINNVFKELPAVLKNNFLFIKNKNDEFINLPENFTILLDSGNATISVIGEDIVNFLQLPIIPGCFSGFGIGGTYSCNGYVELEFKFNSNFVIDNDDTIYKFLLFITKEERQKKIIIFGNKDVLTTLFNKKYVIHNEYDKTDFRYDVNKTNLIKFDEELLKLLVTLNKNLQDKKTDDFYDNLLGLKKVWKNTKRQILIKNKYVSDILLNIRLLIKNITQIYSEIQDESLQEILVLLSKFEERYSVVN